MYEEICLVYLGTSISFFASLLDTDHNQQLHLRYHDIYIISKLHYTDSKSSSLDST